MRRCKIPVGCKKADKPCCADCSDKTCQARCQNSPNLCNCCEEGPPPRRREPLGGKAAPGQSRAERGPRRKVNSLQVVYLHGQVGLAPAEIARWLGCDRSTVYNILRELEVTCRGQA